MSPIDLHTHSTKSDGTYTPGELIRYAQEKGLSAIALTDHDTADGIGEETLSGSDFVAIIPMQNGVDSLNVAASSAVTFWELCR